MRKYNNFAPIGLKSGFVIGMIQFDIEISLICGFAPQMGDKKPCVLGGVGDRIEIRDPEEGTKTVTSFVYNSSVLIEIRDPEEGTKT